MQMNGKCRAVWVAVCVSAASVGDLGFAQAQTARTPAGASPDVVRPPAELLRTPEEGRPTPTLPTVEPFIIPEDETIRVPRDLADREVQVRMVRICAVRSDRSVVDRPASSPETDVPVGTVCSDTEPHALRDPVYEQSELARIVEGFLEKPAGTGRTLSTIKIPKLYEIREEVEKKYRSDGYIISRALVLGQELCPADRDLSQCPPASQVATIHVVEGFVDEITFRWPEAWLGTGIAAGEGGPSSEISVSTRFCQPGDGADLDADLDAEPEGARSVLLDAQWRRTVDLIQAYLRPLCPVEQEPKPLSLETLERALLLANDLPGIDTRAVFRPSGRLGSSNLLVDVEFERFNAFAIVDNYGSNFTNPRGFTVGGRVNNILQMGERLEATTYSSLPKGDGHEAVGLIRLGMPLPLQGLSVNAEASYGASFPRESLAPLEIDSRLITLRGEIGYALWRSRRFNLTGFAGFDYVNSRVEVLQERFSTDRLRVARVNLLGNWRSAFQTGVVANVEGRYGLPIWGRTQDDSFSSRPGASAQFWTVRTDVSILQGLPLGFSTLIRAAGQYANGPLLSYEEFRLGGTQFGRGFQPSELLGDHALALSGEFRFTDNTGLQNFLERYELFGFADYGRVWNIQVNDAADRGEFLLSSGVGVRLSLTPGVNLETLAAWQVKVNSDNALVDNRSPQVFLSLSAAF